MSIRYESIVPWGRSYDEYVHMFALQPSDLKKRILGCGDGPADFNRVVHGQGGVCISIDSVFAFSSCGTPSGLIWFIHDTATIHQCPGKCVFPGGDRA